MKKFYKLFLFLFISLAASNSFARVNFFTVTINPPQCPGDLARAFVNDASIVTAAPTGTLTFRWTRSAVPPTIFFGDTVDIPAGTYIVEVIDAGDPGVTNFSRVEFVNDPVLITPQTSQDSVSCFGDTDGNAIVNVQFGGTPPYNFTWDAATGSQTGMSFTNDTASNLGIGTYRVTITDVNGCAVDTSVTVLGPPQIITSVATSMINCNGGFSIATATTSGGIGNYTYTWSSNPGNMSNVEAGLTAAGSPYSVTTTDETGCTRVDNFTVTEPGPYVINIVTVDVACFGESTGSATATVMGGTPPYVFQWPAVGMPNNNMVTNLPAGSYDVTITDANMCQQIEAFNIATGPEIIINLDSTDVDCNGNATGSVMATITGGNPNYSFVWSEGTNGNSVMAGGTINLNNLTAGTYTITITDASACTEVDSIVVNEPPPINITLVSSDDPLCFNGTDGNIDIDVTGGTPMYSALWSNGATSIDLSNVPAGSYSVTITDMNGCQANFGPVVLNNPAPIIGNIMANPTNCNGGMDGSAAAVPTGGSGNYVNYFWSTGQNGADSTLLNLSPGMYSVTITDSDGCTGAESFTITEPTAITTTITTVNAACFGDMNGTATANTIGGTPPYNYAWGDPAMTVTMDPTNNINILAAGNYVLTITDANGCQVTEPYTINSQPEIILTLDSVDVDCNGNMTGQTGLIITGGTPNFSYIWSSGDMGANIASGARVTADNLTADTYTVTVTDNNGCTAVDSIVVNEPPQLTIMIQSQMDPLCNGDNNGFINVVVAGGTPITPGNTYNFNWGDGPTTQNRSGLSAGNYSVTVTDANGCMETVSTTLTDPAPIIVTIDSLENISCNGFADGFARAAATGGTMPYNFQWPAPTNSTTAENANLPAGTYMVTVTDANGCMATAPATITEPTVIMTSTSSTDTQCSGFNDGTATVTPTGGTPIMPGNTYNFQWDANANNQTTQTATGLVAGTYDVTVTDANGCMVVATATVNQPNTINLTTTNITNVDCNGNSTGSATVSAAGGTAPLTFQWDANTGNQTGVTANNLAAGTYVVTVTDNNGCNENTMVTITEPIALDGSVVSQTDPTCNGIDDGTATVTGVDGTPPYNYTWATVPPQTTATATNLSNGTTDVTITDNNGCTFVQQVTLTAPASVVISVDSIANVNCFGGSDGLIDLSVSGGTMPYTFLWMGGVPAPTNLDQSNLSAGTYDLRVTDNRGCFLDQTFTITEPATGLMASFDTTDVSCNGLADGTAMVTVTGGTAPYNFDWEGTPTGDLTDNITNLAAGTYRLTITDNNGCSIVDSTTVNEPSPIVISLDNTTNVACNGETNGSATVSATGGNGAPFNFVWSTVPPQTNATATNLAAGMYTVTASDQNNCTEVLTVTITEPDTLRPTLFVNNLDCGTTTGGTAAIRASGGTPPYSYLWSTNSTMDSIFNLTAGSYTVTVTDGNGCDSIQMFNINSSSASYTFMDSVRMDSCAGACMGFAGVFNIAGGVAPYSFVWEDGSTNNFRDMLCVGNYLVTISDASGCDSIASFSITESQQIVATVLTIPDTCIGGVGSAAATASGGNAPYTFNWPAGTANGNMVTGLTADNYNVTITDNFGCELIQAFTVGNVAPFSISFITTDPTCFGFANGEILVSTVAASNPVTYNWANIPMGGANPTGLFAGTYPITVTDANGCAAIDTARITNPLRLEIDSVNTTGESCIPGSDGVAVINVSGGTMPYNFNIGNGQVTSNTFTGLTAGIYGVTVQDANFCPRIGDFRIGSIAPFMLNSTVTPASCNGGMDGTVQITPTGGTAPFTYDWPAGSGITGDNPTNVPAGSYLVTVTDANPCTETINITVTEDAPVVVVVSNFQDESCMPGMDGFAVIDISNGLPPYSINWGPNVVDGLGTDSIFNLATDIYFVTVTDANMCSRVLGVPINSAPNITLTTSTTEPTCFGDMDGTITVSAAGGVAPYTYDWGGGIMGPMRTNLPAGNYSITVTDAAVPPCERVEIIGLVQPDPLSIDRLIRTPESCVPGNDGSATITAQGGTDPYQYAFSSGMVNGNNVSGLTGGTYSVTITDANNCSIVEPLIIDNAQDFMVSTTTTDPSCNGLNDGTALVSVVGGMNPFVYNWTGGLSGADPMNIAAGTYEITVTDGFGCTGADTITLIDKDPITATFVITDETCMPGTDGAAVATADNMIPGATFTYQWPASGTSNGNMVSNLVAGNYDVTITDNTGCVNIIPFTIGSSAPFTVTSVVDSVSCKSFSDGSITVSVTGVTVPGSETYTWSPNVSSNGSATNLAAGTYFLTITDPANNCRETEMFVVEEPDTITSNPVIQPVGCNPGGNDGAIDLTTMGGTTPYTFLWEDGSTNEDRSMLVVGTYDVTITDANNCQITESFDVMNQPVIAVNLDSTDLLCNGDNSGAITLSTNANSPIFTWSDGTNTLPATQDQSNLAAGTYFVTVTDGVTNCFGVGSIVVNEPTALVVNIDTTDENCSPGMDGVAIATVMGGTPPYNYNWFDGNGFVPTNSLSNLVAGNYMVEIRDGNGCTITEMYRINNAAPFNLTFTTTDNICQGDSMGIIDITVTNSSSPVFYEWPAPIPNIDTNRQEMIPAGTYVVTVTDLLNGCDETVQIMINEPDTIMSNATITPENCNPGMNGSIIITATGGDMGPYTYNWSGPSIVDPSLEDQTGLSAGRYFLTITDGNNCTAVDSFDVENIITTIPNLTTVNDGCSTAGVCAGSAKVEPTGGVAPYTFMWEGPGGPIASTMDSIGSLCAGNYSVTISDASSCDTVVSFTILPGRVILPNETVVGESCNVDNDGSIVVAPTGGEEPYTYNWAGSAVTGPSRMNLAPGNYPLTITDATGCDTMLTIVVPTEQFDYTIDSTDLSCSGINDGRVDITIVGGSTGFTFMWNPTPTTGDGTANISDLTAGQYFVTITQSSNGCSKVDSITVNPMTPILPNEMVMDESCNATNDGSITLNPMGGAGNYLFNWSPNVSSTATAMNLAAGTYDVTITDQAGCDTSLTLTVQAGATLLATITTTDAVCSNSCDGTASIVVTGGQAPYVYTWDPGITLIAPDSAEALCPGSYNVTVTDMGGCSVVESFTINGPNPITPNLVVTNSTCNISNGQLEAMPSGGSGGYTIEWFDAANTSLGMANPITGLAAGAYSVLITDNSGCFETFTTSINDIGAEMIVTTFSDVSCFNGSDGTATVSFTCSDPGCTIEWFDAATGMSIGQTSNTATGLIAGDYFVEVINNSGCLAVENITISEPDQYQIFESIINNICGGGNTGSIGLTVSGGTGPYTYNWSPAPGMGQGTSSVSNLLAGTYDVTISDGNSCDSIMSFIINEPLQLTSTFSTTSSNCNQSDGSITATVTGGTVAADYLYQWFDGNNNLLVGETNATISNIPSGNYALRVRDDNVCERRFTVSLSDANGPTVIIDSTFNAGCFGESNGAIFITAQGNNPPFAFNWSPTGQVSEDITGLPVGRYTVRVTDAVGCETIVSDTIMGSSELSANITALDATCGLCNGMATATITGGTAPYTYLWSDGSTMDSSGDSLCGGNHSLMVTDAQGCSKTFDFAVNTVGGPTGETVTVTPATCANTNDGTATVVPIGGTPPYTYTWQHNGATTNSLNNLAAGTYFLQISDVRSCSRTVQVDITSPPALLIEQQITSATCNSVPGDGSILLTVSGGTAPYTYNWQGFPIDTNFRDILTAGIYPVTVSDANGCSESLSINVSNTGVPANVIPTVTDVSCNGFQDGSLVSNLVGSTDVDFRWLDANNMEVAPLNTDAISSVPAGNYTLELTTVPLGCRSFISVQVNEPDSITLSSSIVRNVSCNGSEDGEIFINTRGGSLLYSYSWNDANNQNQIPAIGLRAGTYMVTATDANGCSKTTSITLTDPPVLTVAAAVQKNLICSSDCDGEATSTVTGGVLPYSYEWRNDGQVISTDPNPTNLCFGENILTVIDANRCMMSAAINISATDTVIAESFGSPIVCDGDSIILDGMITGNSISSFGWFLADGTTLFTSSLDTGFIAPPGDYTYLLIATSGTCSDTAFFNVTVTPNPVVGLPGNLRIFTNESIQIDLTGNDTSYTYTWSPATFLDDSTAAEPTTSATEDITYNLTVVDTNGCIYEGSVFVLFAPDLEIPSGFSPNGDGNNDVWNIGFLDQFPQATVQIFNRWGQLLYESNNGYTPWDGTYDGEELPIGTYYYIIDLKDPEIEPVTGPITIVK